MQINTFSNVASMAQAQVSNKKADGNATENTKTQMFKVPIQIKIS